MSTDRVERSGHTPGRTVEVRGRAYPAWAIERLTERQVDRLPPTLLWAKVVQVTDATASPAARGACHALAVEIHSDAEPRPVSVGALARYMGRSRSHVTEGLNDLEALGFLTRGDRGNGRRKSYTLTLPLGDPDLTGERSGSAVEPDRTAVRSASGHDHEEGEPDRRAVTPDRTAATTRPESGHDLTGGRPPQSKSMESLPTGALPRAPEGEEEILDKLEAAANGRVRDVRQRRRSLAALTRQALEAGWTPRQVVAAATERDLTDAGHVGAVLEHRLRELLDDESPAARASREEAALRALPADDPRRRNAEGAALEAPGRPPGPIVTLDELDRERAS